MEGAARPLRKLIDDIFNTYKNTDNNASHYRIPKASK